jgi:hypothetical protein
MKSSSTFGCKINSLSIDPRQNIDGDYRRTINLYIFFDLPVRFDATGLVSLLMPCLFVSTLIPDLKPFCFGFFLVASRLVTAPEASEFGGGVIPVPSLLIYKTFSLLWSSSHI